MENLELRIAQLEQRLSRLITEMEQLEVRLARRLATLESACEVSDGL
jgi:chaperonin cofactor prefoldin